MKSRKPGRIEPMGRLAGVLLASALLSWQCGAADNLYSFTDEQGVAHFSNVPHDPRYRVVTGAGAPAPRFDGRAVLLALSVSAPQSVPKGGMLEVSVAMPGTASVRGQVDLLYDPAALEFDEATVDADLVGQGRVRLRVDPGIASVFAAEVWFAVRRDAPDQTVLRSQIIDLESDERVALRGVAAEAVVVRLERARQDR